MQDKLPAKTTELQAILAEVLLPSEGSLEMDSAGERRVQVDWQSEATDWLLEKMDPLVTEGFRRGSTGAMLLPLPVAVVQHSWHAVLSRLELAVLVLRPQCHRSWPQVEGHTSLVPAERHSSPSCLQAELTEKRRRTPSPVSAAARADYVALLVAAPRRMRGTSLTEPAEMPR
eukprot:TRINITY_DN65106_c0_g1_i1.p2 TRINITY_DN65106_c0_g1~~TRINITY_DN65106_c0_g1_i1.p2  ORF type:complete len:173 (-),score=26.92 TRINITY_DN65106_c0_g1_i1:1313-1831(-)